MTVDSYEVQTLKYIKKRTNGWTHVRWKWYWTMQVNDFKEIQHHSKIHPTFVQHSISYFGWNVGIIYLGLKIKFFKEVLFRDITDMLP